jgi:hypothetical protein
MSTFPYQLKLLGASGRCRVAKTWYQSQRCRVRILADAIYQNKFQLTPISRLCPMGAAREGEW